MSVANAVIGAADHYARAELVTLALRDAAPVFLDRRRVVLIDKGLPSAPYHHEALELDLRAAIDLVNRVRQSVAQRASAAISTMLATYGARVLILPASPYDGLSDSLEEVLRSLFSGWPRKIHLFGLYFLREYSISLVWSTSTGCPATIPATNG